MMPIQRQIIASAKRVIVGDSFNRDDSATTLGKADTNQSWVADVGTWGLLNGQAYVASSSGGRDRAVIDSGYANAIISCTFAATNVSQDIYLVFRYTNNQNEYRLIGNANTKYQLVKVASNVTTTLAEWNASPKSGDKVLVKCNGDLIAVYLNGRKIMLVTDNFNSTKTKHGIGAYNNTNARWDDFKVVAL